MTLPQLVAKCFFGQDVGAAYKDSVLAGFPLGYWRLGNPNTGVLDTGALPANGVVDDASVGTKAWSTPTNAQASDDVYAGVAGGVGGGTSHYLKTSSHGAVVPAHAIIRGIEVRVERHKSAGGVTDSSVRLVKGGVISGADRSAAASWVTTVDTVAVFGGPTDLWGLTLTPADVNAVGFGAALSCFVSPTTTASVDLISITVYYSGRPATTPDSSGNVQTGTVSGSGSFEQPGALPGDTDWAAFFDGATSFVSVPDSVILSPTVPVLTIEAWVNLIALPAVNGYIAVKANSYGLDVTNAGKLRFSFDGNPVAASVTSTGATLAIGQWYHVVATWDSVNVRFYVNGALDSTVALTGTLITDNANPLTIGAGTAANFLNATLDEIAVYASVLPADTISYHYESRNVNVAAPTATDISDHVREASWGRGKNHELDQIEPSSGSAKLKNEDRRFEANFLGSPYYPNVVPETRMTFDFVYNAVTYPQGEWYVERWPQEWLAPGHDGQPDYAENDIAFTDGLSLFNADEGVSFVGPQELSGARMNRLCQALGIPSTKRNIDAGGMLLQAQTLASENALSHAQDVETTEHGIFFHALDGRYTFYDKSRQALAHSPSLYTFGDAADGSEFPYMKLTPDFGNENLYNDVRVTRNGGIEQVASDAPARRRFRRRTLKVSTLGASDIDALAFAQYLLAQYVQPLMRVQEMVCVIGEGADPAYVVALLSLELGNRLTVIRRPGGQAAPIITQQVIVEKIAVSSKPDAIVFTFELAPADTTVYWQLDTVGSSELNSTARLSL